MQNKVSAIFAASRAPPSIEESRFSGAAMAIAIIEAINTTVKMTFINYFYDVLVRKIRRSAISLKRFFTLFKMQDTYATLCYAAARLTVVILSVSEGSEKTYRGESLFGFCIIFLLYLIARSARLKSA